MPKFWPGDIKMAPGDVKLEILGAKIPRSWFFYRYEFWGSHLPGFVVFDVVWRHFEIIWPTL